MSVCSAMTGGLSKSIQIWWFSGQNTWKIDLLTKITEKIKKSITASKYHPKHCPIC